MKEPYETPQMEIIEFEPEDVILASSPGSSDCSSDCVFDCNME